MSRPTNDHCAVSELKMALCITFQGRRGWVGKIESPTIDWAIYNRNIPCLGHESSSTHALFQQGPRSMLLRNNMPAGAVSSIYYLEFTGSDHSQVLTTPEFREYYLVSQDRHNARVLAYCRYSCLSSINIFVISSHHARNPQPSTAGGRSVTHSFQRGIVI